MLAAAILGVMVIGGMTNELVVAKTALKIGSGKSATQIQSVLDGIMPKMIPLAATWIMYFIIKSGKVKPMFVILSCFVIGIVLNYFGILAC